MAEQPGEDSLSLDALLILKHVAVHETVQHGGVGMNINVELQTDSLMEEKRRKNRKRTERDGDGERHTQKIKTKTGRLVWKMGSVSDRKSSRRQLRWGGALTPEPPDTADQEYVYDLSGANHPHITSIRVSF